MTTPHDYDPPAPLLTPHAFAPGDAAAWGPTCKLCGLLPSSPRHDVVDDRPSISELQRAVERADEAKIIDSAPVLLEIASALLAEADAQPPLAHRRPQGLQVRG